jgi:hypothetical protein
METKDRLNVYLLDDGEPFAVIWYNKEDIISYYKETMELFNDTPTICELTEKEDWEWGFGWSFDMGNTILSSYEAIKYLEDNNMVLETPIHS